MSIRAPCSRTPVLQTGRLEREAGADLGVDVLPLGFEVEGRGRGVLGGRGPQTDEGEPHLALGPMDAANRYNRFMGRTW